MIPENHHEPPKDFFHLIIHLIPQFISRTDGVNSVGEIMHLQQNTFTHYPKDSDDVGLERIYFVMQIK